MNGKKPKPEAQKNFRPAAGKVMRKKGQLAGDNISRVEALQQKSIIDGALGFLKGTQNLASSDVLPKYGPSFLDGLGVRKAPEHMADESVDTQAYIKAISTTSLSPLTRTSSNDYVSRYYGVSKQPTVPSVLTENAIFRSWTTSIPWGLASDLRGQTYYGIKYSVPDAMTFLASDFTSLPSSADLASYLKLISSIKAGTYSQSARLDQQVGPSFPLYLVNGDLTATTFPKNLIDLSDTLTFDPRGALTIAPRVATLLNASTISVNQYETRFAWNGQLDPLNPTNAAISAMMSPGSAYGFTGFLDQAIIPGAVTGTSLLEFIRQLVCSPLLRLTALPRPSLAGQLGLAEHTSGATYQTITANETAHISPPSTIGTVGNGGVSVYIDFVLRDDSTFIEQLYPTIDFAVNFSTVDSLNPPTLVVPRGVNISNVYHPGFALPDAATVPIIFDPSATYSYTLQYKFLTWGVASNYTWGLSLSNPASNLLGMLA